MRPPSIQPRPCSRSDSLEMNRPQRSLPSFAARPCRAAPRQRLRAPGGHRRTIRDQLSTLARQPRPAGPLTRFARYAGRESYHRLASTGRDLAPILDLLWYSWAVKPAKRDRQEPVRDRPGPLLDRRDLNRDSMASICAVQGRFLDWSAGARAGERAILDPKSQKRWRMRDGARGLAGEVEKLAGERDLLPEGNDCPGPIRDLLSGTSLPQERRVCLRRARRASIQGNARVQDWSHSR